MIRLEKVLKTSLQDVSKMSGRRLEDVLKMSWKSLQDVLKTFLQDVLKTSWRRFEDVLKTSWRRMTKTNILALIKTSWGLLEDVFWRRMSKVNIFVLIKTSSSCLHQEECLLGKIYAVYNWLATNHLVTGNAVNSILTSTMDKIYHGPVIAIFSEKKLKSFLKFFNYAGYVLSIYFLFLLLLMFYGYTNYKAKGAFMIIFFIYSNLLNCLRNVCTVAIRTKLATASKLSLTKKILTASSHFCCFDAFPLWPTQKFQVFKITLKFAAYF